MRKNNMHRKARKWISLRMLMQKIAKAVTNNPTKIIAVILVITLLMSSVIMIKGIKQRTDEESYMPDSEIANAHIEIGKEYTAVESITILVKDDDVLTNSSLIEILEIEKKILKNEEVKKILDNPDFLEGNVFSVADITAQNLFGKELYVRLYGLMLTGKLNITQEQMQLIMYAVPSKLTMEQKIAVLEGGNFTVDIMQNFSLNFSFNKINNSALKDFIKEMLTNSNGNKIVQQNFPMLLTKEFNATNISTIKAKATLILISANASIEDKGKKFLKAEEEMKNIINGAKETKMGIIADDLINEEILSAVTNSMMYLIPIAMVIVIIILMIIYRSWRDMLFSLLALVFAIIWMYGFGVIFDFTFNPITTAVPILIIGIGIDYGIYVTMRYREELRKGQNVKTSAFTTIACIGSALFLVMLTSVIAFLSNISSQMTLLKEFGILCAVGVLSAYIIMNTFVPAVKQLKDARREKKGLPVIRESKTTKSIGLGTLDKFLSKSAVGAEKHPYTVILVSVLLIAGAFYGVINVKTEFNFKDFLPKELQLTQDINFLGDEFELGAREEVAVLVKGDIANPELLKEIDSATKNMNNDEYVIKYNNSTEAKSILTFMYDYATLTENDFTFNMSFALLYNQYFENGIPKANTTKANITELYEWLYKNANKEVRAHLHKGNSYDGTVIRIAVDTEGGKEDKSKKLYEELNEDIKGITKAKAIVTSGPVLYYVIIKSINASQISSMIITILSAVIILTLMFYRMKKSFVLGLFASIPVMFCAVWIIGSMYFMDIPLNVMTLTITSLTIGLGIEYGIQITYRFLEDLENNEIEEACRLTVKEMGSSLVGCAGTTVAAFGLLVFSIMPPLQQFGVLMALTIVYAFFSSVFILPTILVLWAKYRKKNGTLNKKKEEEKVEKSVKDIEKMFGGNLQDIFEDAKKGK